MTKLKVRMNMNCRVLFVLHDTIACHEALAMWQDWQYDHYKFMNTMTELNNKTA